MKQRQQGVALLVSLIILLVLSLIGLSAMRGGLLQTLMASNAQQAEMAFSAADSGVGAVVSWANNEGGGTGSLIATAATTGAMQTRFVDSAGDLVPDETALDADRDAALTTVQADLTHLGCLATCPGYSSVIKSTATLKCHEYRIDSASRVADMNAQVQQWVSSVGAACI